MTEKQKAMRDVQEHGFAAVDASLYLDSHPDDESAVQYFRNVCKKTAAGTRGIPKAFWTAQAPRCRQHRPMELGG